MCFEGLDRLQHRRGSVPRHLPRVTAALIEVCADEDAVTVRGERRDVPRPRSPDARREEVLLDIGYVERRYVESPPPDLGRDSRHRMRSREVADDGDHAAALLEVLD